MALWPLKGKLLNQLLNLFSCSWNCSVALETLQLLLKFWIALKVSSFRVFLSSGYLGWLFKALWCFWIYFKDLELLQLTLGALELALKALKLALKALKLSLRSEIDSCSLMFQKWLTIGSWMLLNLALYVSIKTCH